MNKFSHAYQNIPNINSPLKVHVLLAHLCEFIEKYSNGKGLGFYSKQTGEAIHQKFEPVLNKYQIKNIFSEQYGQRLLKAVIEFSFS